MRQKPAPTLTVQKGIVMRRFAFCAVLLLVVAYPLTAAAQDRVVRTVNESFDPSGYEAVKFDLSVGELHIEGGSGSEIEVQVRVRCSNRRNRDRCEDRAADVAIESYERRGKLVVEIEGTGLWRSRDAHVLVSVTVPEGQNFDVEMGTGELSLENIAGDVFVEFSVGEATLTNMSGNLTVDMGIGDISVTMPESAVATVTLDNGIGETALYHSGGKNSMEGILGGTDVEWKSGPGTHDVEVDLNVGEINVRLR